MERQASFRRAETQHREKEKGRMRSGYVSSFETEEKER